MSCLEWDLNPQHCVLRGIARAVCRCDHPHNVTGCTCTCTIHAMYIIIVAFLYSMSCNCPKEMEALIIYVIQCMWSHVL